MQSLLNSEIRSKPLWVAEAHEWVWSNLPRIAIVLSSITSICCLVWIALGPVRAPGFLQIVGDGSLALTAMMVGLYCSDLFWGLSRAREFWLNKELGFYTVVAALFFSAGFHDLRLFAQNHRFDRDVTEELLVMAVLWSAQYWKNEGAKELLTVVVAGTNSEPEPDQITQLGLSSPSNPAKRTPDGTRA